MPEVNKSGISILDYIDIVADNMKYEIEHQRQVIKKHIEDEKENGKNIDYCCLIDCPLKKNFCRTLYETIQALEATKRSFKSKELETLRNDLQEVLLEVK